MNKNTALAFFLIICAVMFFTSQTYQKFYTEKILKKEWVKKSETDKKITQNEDKEKGVVKTPDNSKKIETIPISTDTNSYKNDTVWVENEKIIVGIESKGAKIISLSMKDYKEDSTKQNINLLRNLTDGAAQIKIGEKDFSNSNFIYKGIHKKNKVDKEIKIEFALNEDNENGIRKTFVFNKDSYQIGIEISKSTLPGEKLTLAWNSGVKESEKVINKSLQNRKIIHIASSDEMRHFVLKHHEKEGPIAGRYKWVGVTTKYFLVAINNEGIVDSDIKIQSFGEKSQENNYKFEISRMAEQQKEKFSIYVGPTERKELKKYNQQYEKVLFPVISWGRILFWSERWFPWLADKVLLLLLVIQSFVKDFGIAIIVITIITKIITYPMTMSSMKSMEKMKNIQPKVNKIRLKLKNNPQKMNEEIMALYKKEGVNPLNPGCIPIFLQMPIFISLFVVLQYSVEIRGMTTFLIPWIKDLSKPEEIFSLAAFLPNGIPMYGTNVALLPVINAVLTYFQQKSTITDPNQKMLIYFMPIFMLVIFNSFPSGLVLYWTFSTAIQSVQQLIMKKIAK